MGGVVSSVFDTVGDVVDSVVDVVEDVVDGVGDFVGQIGEAAIDFAASPVGQIALQLIPVTAPYAKYITAAAKVANGQDLTAADFVSLGIQGMSDFDTGITVPDAVKTAAKVGARMNSSERLRDMLEERKILISKDISDLESADLAELVTDLQSKLTSQEASQKAFINITKLNLFDYIS